MIILVMAHDNERLIFYRQQQYLVSALNRIRQNRFKLKNDAAPVARFKTAVMAFVAKTKDHRDENMAIYYDKVDLLQQKGFTVVYEDTDKPKK